MSAMVLLVFIKMKYCRYNIYSITKRKHYDIIICALRGSLANAFLLLLFIHTEVTRKGSEKRLNC